MSETDMPWELQLQFWGYELQGEITNDIAMLVERHKGGLMFSEHEWWDYTREDLDRIIRFQRAGPNSDDIVQVDVPEHWALPAVTELRIMWDREFWELTKELET